MAQGRFDRIAPTGGNSLHLPGRQDEQAADEDRLRDPAGLVLRRLERLARRLGEAVEVEAVIPVGTPDERQVVGAQAVERVLDRALKVLVQWLLGTGLVVVRDELVENARVSGFLEVRRHAQDQPGRVVVEAGSNLVIATLGQWLVLVVCAARWKLCRGDVQNSFPRPCRDHVYEAEQILI